MTSRVSSHSYDRIKSALNYLEENKGNPLSSKDLALAAGLGQDVLEQELDKLCGMSPSSYQQFFSLKACKQRLSQSQQKMTSHLYGSSLLTSSFDAKNSFEEISIEESYEWGSGHSIFYGYGNSRWGKLLIGMTEKGVCYIGFVDDESGSLIDLKSRWPKADFYDSPEKCAKWTERVSCHVEQEPKDRLPLHLIGTKFQVSVWRFLIKISLGNVLSYGDVARGVGKPTATRAIASAIGRNPISCIIPCHRVISSRGKIHRYHWGAVRKKAMNASEAVAEGSNSPELEIQ